jgi:hypothetical protein
MTTDWASDVKNMHPMQTMWRSRASSAIGIALQSRDASLVAFSDKSELDRVRDSFLKKKLGLTQSDDELDAAINAVGDKMRTTPPRTGSRSTICWPITSASCPASADANRRRPIKDARRARKRP